MNNPTDLPGPSVRVLTLPEALGVPDVPRLGDLEDAAAALLSLTKEHPGLPHLLPSFYSRERSTIGLLVESPAAFEQVRDALRIPVGDVVFEEHGGSCQLRAVRDYLGVRLELASYVMLMPAPAVAS